MKQLTVILAFLNEGSELEKTLESLKIDSNFEKKCKVVLINDGSTDDYDYVAVARKYDALYIAHDKQMGASYSKNEGVELTETEYFMILDAHMRALTEDWVDKVLSALEKDKQAIYCCGCRSLKWEENDVYMNNLLGLCAYVDFVPTTLFKLGWIIQSRIPSHDTILQVPVVLGGSYCGSVDYWKYIHGLQQQVLFGHEELMLSLKSWVIGNGAKCITNVEFAHKFRQGIRKYPGWGALFNLMLSVYLVLPDEMFLQTKKFWQKTKTSAYQTAETHFDKNIKALEEERKYILSIAHRDYASFEHFNSEFKTKYINVDQKIQS